MCKAETLRNIRVLLVIHFGGEHLIRPRVDFEVAVERLIDHQRFDCLCMRGDGEDLIQFSFEVQVFLTDQNFSCVHLFLLLSLLFIITYRQENIQLFEKYACCIRVALSRNSRLRLDQGIL